jgi:hypothetical protein
MLRSYDKPDLAKICQLIADGINVRFMAGCTALISAAFYNHVEVVRALLEADPSPEHILISTPHRITALSCAKSDEIRCLLTQHLEAANAYKSGGAWHCSQVPDAMYNEMVDIFVRDKKHKLTAKPMLVELRKTQKKETVLPEHELKTLWAKWRKEAKMGTVPNKRGTA